jgi:hypothetical protein
MHPTDEVRVSTRAMRQAAAVLGSDGSAVAPTDELLAALDVLSRDASAGWPSVRAAVTSGLASAADAGRLVTSILDVATSLRTAADAYDAVDERAGPQLW